MRVHLCMSLCIYIKYIRGFVYMNKFECVISHVYMFVCVFVCVFVCMYGCAWFECGVCMHVCVFCM